MKIKLSVSNTMPASQHARAIKLPKIIKQKQSAAKARQYRADDFIFFLAGGCGIGIGGCGELPQ